MRESNHDCELQTPADLETSLHDAQAGVGRWACVKHAWRHGYESGKLAVEDDRRRSVWTDSHVDRCTHASAAPSDVLAELPKSQGYKGRHLCAICAWARGFKDGTIAAKKRGGSGGPAKRS